MGNIHTPYERRQFMAECADANRPCHICHQPIDYTLPPGRPGTFELDHLIPRTHAPELITADRLYNAYDVKFVTISKWKGCGKTTPWRSPHMETAGACSSPQGVDTLCPEHHALAVDPAAPQSPAHADDARGTKPSESGTRKRPCRRRCPVRGGPNVNAEPPRSANTGRIAVTGAPDTGDPHTHPETSPPTTSRLRQTGEQQTVP